MLHQRVPSCAGCSGRPGTPTPAAVARPTSKRPPHADVSPHSVVTSPARRTAINISRQGHILNAAKQQVVDLPQQAAQAAALRRVQELLVSGETVDVTVRACNSGGLLCDILQLQGFLPYSELATVQPRRGPGPPDMEYLIGQTLRVKVKEVDMQPDKRRLLLSEKRAKMGDMLARLKVGDVMRGRVSGLSEYGLFVDLVDLPGLTGLVHKSEVSWDRVVSLDSLYSRDAPVTVKVVDVDAGKARVALSIKQLTADPLKMTLDTVAWGATRSVPVEVQKLVDQLAAAPGVNSIVLSRQAQDTHHISQELQVFMTRAEIPDGYVVVARLGSVLQELQLMTEMSRDDVKALLQRVFQSRN